MIKCVFTIVRDEAKRLPMWLGYYSKWFAMEDIVVLDNGSQDGSTSQLPCRVVDVPTQYAFDHSWLLHTVQWWFKELLGQYDWVTFVECDEMLWHPDGLGPYIDSIDAKKHADITAKGYELIHIKEYEPPIDMSKPIGEQRRFWFHRSHYSKTLMANHPIEWCLGFHSCYNKLGVYDEQLLLVHLHRLDYQMAYDMHAQRRKMTWSPKDLLGGFGRQNLVVDEEFDKWYYDCETPPVEIPKDTRLNFGF